MTFEPADYPDEVLAFMEHYNAYCVSCIRATLSAMQIADLDRNDKQSNSEKVWPQLFNRS